MKNSAPYERRPSSSSPLNHPTCPISAIAIPLNPPRHLNEYTIRSQNEPPSPPKPRCLSLQHSHQRTKHPSAPLHIPGPSQRPPNLQHCTAPSAQSLIRAQNIDARFPLAQSAHTHTS
ncbi:hypothetical protein EJ04DRAFT_141315 [Polyplosphaeria fusca]|uniref:Uncharacterized protein n=1 Tax=Polyplosphaeria fusca TaxID=682080 RepID=A0A9P4UUK8_9PLEO|nr:hypothetical protein EJ04DRAFT_141315 [Polyplosphaeria fusca]